MASAEHRRVAELQVNIAGLHAGGSAVRADGTYLDKQSAEGTLQTRHRESVVSFIFEVCATSNQRARGVPVVLAHSPDRS